MLFNLIGTWCVEKRVWLARRGTLIRALLVGDEMYPMECSVAFCIFPCIVKVSRVVEKFNLKLYDQFLYFWRGFFILLSLF